MRLYGRQASQFPDYSALSPLPSPTHVHRATVPQSSEPNSSLPTLSIPSVPALPLTPDAFSAYGSVIQSYPDHRSARKDVAIKSVNFGTASKFKAKVSAITFLQPPALPHIKGEVNFSVFRCDAQNTPIGIDGKQAWDVKILERHEYSSQSFVPMGGGGKRYLVVVALPGAG